MTRSDRRTILLAFCLAGMAGYVDSLGFLTLNGFFVSFMSGNSTKLSVGLAEGSLSPIRTASGLIGLFVLGVIAGTFLNHLVHERRPRILQFVAALLALGATAASTGHDRWAIAMATLALGAENTVLQKAGEISISVTYMTGTLVKMGQGIAKAVLGGKRWEWVPYLLLWAALVLGAVVGAALFPVLRLRGLWIAAAWCLALAPASRAAVRDPAAASQPPPEQ